MERVAEQRKPDERRWGLIPSILLHILFFAALFLLPVVAMPIPQPEDSIHVEMVPQPKEQAENAATPTERSGRVPTPTPKPDQKDPSKEKAASATDKTEGEQTADKLSDESKTKTQEGPAPNAQDQDAKSQEQAQVDKPADVKADQPAPATQPGDTPSPTSADNQTKPQDQTPATGDQTQTKQQDQTPPNSDPATEAQKQDQTPPPQQQTADQTVLDALAAEAAAAANAQPQTNVTPPASDAASQEAPAEEAAKTDAEAKAAKADAATSATDPNSSDPASTPMPQELATDQASDTQVTEPDKPSTDQAGMQADQKNGAASDPVAGQSKTAEGQVDQNAQQQAAADPKVAPDVAVPTTGGAQPQQQSQDQSISGTSNDSTAGTTFVPEPQPRPQQSSSADTTQQASTSGPSQTQQKPADKTGGRQGKFIQAKRFYSGTEMARMSKDELDAWKKLPRLERVRQLCNSEEKLQFGHELRAVGFINSALSPAMISTTGLYGDGVAIQTPKGWQQVQFKCQVDEDALKVAAFSYAVKGRIPASRLEKLGVPSN
ncbi:DUF930 domain-containing protein [Rhizobium sp. BR 362]|uniref:DUF930 domain-containing protein n=1 Tax=Rhizobium sp. BR 362 TaxID=3040670 RepID=UPI002F42C8D4